MKRWPIVSLALLAGLLLGLVIGNPFLHGQVGQQPAVPIPKELTSFRTVVKTVLPAVVSIESTTKVVKTKAVQPRQGAQPRQLPFDQSQIPEEFRRFFEDYGR